VPVDQPARKSRPIAIIVLFVLLAVAIAIVIHAAASWHAAAAARKLKNPVLPTADALATGKQIYGEHCRSCHGEKGDGKGEKAAELSVAPGDFTDQRAMSRRTDGELFWQVTRGRLPMPAFEDKLTDQERWQLVDYIRTFAGKSPSAGAGPASALTSALQGRQQLP
jgi:mono/diheme cytochrome c family protein